MPGFASRAYASIRHIYSPRYIALNIAAAVIYYFIFGFLIRYQNYGILLISVPVLLVYAVIASASVLLTVSVFSIHNTRRNQAKVAASSLSAVTLVVGGVLGGCGCAEPLIFGLGTLGISSSTLFSVNAVLTAYASQIFIAMVLVNLILILYYLNKLSKPACMVRPRARKRG